MFMPADRDTVDGIVKKALAGENLTREEIEQYKGYILVHLGKQYARLHWVQQYHIGALRNNSRRYMSMLGPDTGFDAIEDQTFAKKLALLLDTLDSTDELPKTILYCLNPRDNEVLAAMINCFQHAGVVGKMQFGSAWWFNDQKDGMERQLMALSQLGLVSKFVGMLTDSRSFLSYTRHDYFRRILCNMFGTLIEEGEYPDDVEFAGQIVKDICYNNAVNYFTK
jgi:glucuronate isomerase